MLFGNDKSNKNYVIISDLTLILKKGINFWTLLSNRGIADFNNHSFTVWNFSIQTC